MTETEILDLPETPETPKKTNTHRFEKRLALIAGVLLLITAALAALAIPFLEQDTQDPEFILQNRPQATMPPPTEAPEAPTEPEFPPPEKNPYGKLDFQYSGRYLSCLKADTVPGIDVSYYQGKIDWEQVKASGIRFAIIRLGYRGYGEEGKLVEDKKAPSRRDWMWACTSSPRPLPWRKPWKRRILF